MLLTHNIQQVEDKVSRACARAGRDRNDVQVIAVTKYVSVQTTGQVLIHGLRHIGENRWQDAGPKWEAFKDQGIWHFIGHLQTNKVKDVIGKFTYIHSLDRLSLAKEIEKKAAALDIQVECFIQLNISGEETKYGMQPEELPAFIEELKTYKHIRIIGLMTMAPYETEPELTRPVFRKLRQLRDELNQRQSLGYEIPHLSMGMSGDFEVAIEEGATWVRLGSILVGKEEITWE
ncbi:YggS family pyridoxal phosphate-dependent enzyme [Paenibacillus radicis (ex Xue et al. 2023)]|uniref:Pyridoxal phosphate homeostasis protein n=1 Tax=Paenibacillus radicis (ex Xue et al. 2023) TaxID=2972489 RepID=A0ABT1YP56_9BACL|nr:YggS family pyridoxal phosphate-dependent enzyme [Paenibacillus radicis (ex Xue et al. 2023)]MCR8634952.1 YggS family pyridoxal phosphate-dependent enzyme [Paenibacillus radicis (ex Xue et al. 2023)]